MLMGVSGPWTAHTSSQATFFCQNFEFPVQTKANVFTRAAPAIVHLTVGQGESAEYGTGFVIDASRGYVITAGHVTKSVTSAEVRIIGVTDERPDLLMELALVKTLYPKIDAALLQIKLPPNHLRSLDIAFRPSRLGSPLYTAGYRRGEKVRRLQEVEQIAPISPERLEIRQTTYPGDSGSPLLDERGQVVAVCVERPTNAVTALGGPSDVAYYLPAVYLAALLDSIVLRPEVLKLHERLLGGQLGALELNATLAPSTSTVTNTDLYSWLRELSSVNVKTTESVRALVQCPLLTAAIDRRLADAVLRLDSLANTGHRAQIYEGLAVREAWVGRFDQSRVLSARANRLSEQWNKELLTRFGSIK
jgi:S1-C subfamily serine protease